MKKDQCLDYVLISSCKISTIRKVKKMEQEKYKCVVSIRIANNTYSIYFLARFRIIEQCNYDSLLRVCGQIIFEMVSDKCEDEIPVIDIIFLFICYFDTNVYESPGNIPRKIVLIERKM